MLLDKHYRKNIVEGFINRSSTRLHIACAFYYLLFLIILSSVTGYTALSETFSVWHETSPIDAPYNAKVLPEVWKFLLCFLNCRGCSLGWKLGALEIFCIWKGFFEKTHPDMALHWVSNVFLAVGWPDCFDAYGISGWEQMLLTGYCWSLPLLEASLNPEHSFTLWCRICCSAPLPHPESVVSPMHPGCKWESP